jgi:hypothetical protein
MICGIHAMRFEGTPGIMEWLVWCKVCLVFERKNCGGLAPREALYLEEECPG